MRHRGSTPTDFEAGPVDGQTDLVALASALWRRKFWIIVPTIAAGIAAAVFVTFATPLYRSQALVLIENRETAYSRPEGEDRIGDRARPDPEAVQSEVQLALSRDLARTVVRDLKLGERAEFNPAASTSPVAIVLRLVGLSRDPGRMTFEERVLERYYEKLSVYQLERSRVIAIDFRSESPTLAAEVANTIAARLLEFQRAAKQESMRQAAHWLSGEIEQLRTRVSEAEAKADAFRSQSNLYVGSNNTPLSAQNLAELNSQLVLARTQRADAETKARLIREMLRTNQPIEASDIVNSELIRRLNEQRVTLRAQLAEQSSTLLDRHPRIKELRAQIADLEAQTRAEAAKLVRSLENDAKMIGARVAELQADLDQAKKQASALGAEDVQLRALEREAKAQRDLLESYLARYRDVTARESPDAVQPDARILSQAVPPSLPYYPRRVPIVLIVMLATALTAATLIALGELLSGSSHARSASRAPALPAELPAAAAPAWIEPREEPMVAAGRSTQPESRRIAPIADHVEAIGKGIVAVTALDDNRLGSDVALELARELGARNAKVLLLNMELAANAIADITTDPRAPGLADLLFGVAHFGEVIQRDPSSRIHVIPVGRGLRDSPTIYKAGRLAIVLGALSQTYDHVIASAPALAQTPEAARFGRFVRGTLLIVPEDRENAGAAASDDLGAKGFANVAIVAVSPIEDAGPSTQQAA